MKTAAARVTSSNGTSQAEEYQTNIRALKAAKPDVAFDVTPDRLLTTINRSLTCGKIRLPSILLRAKFVERRRADVSTAPSCRRTSRIAVFRRQNS